MKIPSPAQLVSRLDRSLAWRKKELTQLKLIADSASTGSEPVLRRSGLSLLYAHWEGFVKDAASYYLTYLSGEPIELNKLRSCFIAIALRGSIRTSGQAKCVSAHARLIDLIQQLGQPPVMSKRLPVKNVISTKSNLKGVVLREITSTLGLDYTQFELKERPIIDRLVQFRNAISHGEYHRVSSDDYEVLHREIILLMDAFKNLIQDAASNSKHLR